MKACIIGGGPSGLYLSKFLAQNDFKVSIFEKDSTIGGCYKYAQLPETKLNTFKRILNSKNINLITGVEINENNFTKIENLYDVFVLATGGVPKNYFIDGKKALDAENIIKKIMNNKLDVTLGSKILVIGMGNVALDLVKLLLGGFKTGISKSVINQLEGIKSIDVVSRSDLVNSKFTNPTMRDVLSLKNVSFSVNGLSKIKNTLLNWNINELVKSIWNKFCVSEDRKVKSRYKMFEKLPQTDCSRTIGLLFNTNIDHIENVNDLYVVKFSNGIKKTYDSIISSIGYATNDIKINTNKPIYRLGWCNKPGGSINDALFQAEQLAQKIINLKNKQFNCKNVF